MPAPAAAALGAVIRCPLRVLSRTLAQLIATSTTATRESLGIAITFRSAAGWKPPEGAGPPLARKRRSSKYPPAPKSKRPSISRTFLTDESAGTRTPLSAARQKLERMLSARPRRLRFLPTMLARWAAVAQPRLQRLHESPRRRAAVQRSGKKGARLSR